MDLINIFNKKTLKKNFYHYLKDICYTFKKRGQSTPVFIFGKQRSGTTMVMYVFELCPLTKIYDERLESEIYRDCVIRNFDVIHKTLKKSRAPFTVYKAICDSHKINDFLNIFKKCKCIWIYRNYIDVSNSSVKKFPHSDNSLRIVAEGKTGGGWFQDGISKESSEVIRNIYSPDFSRFESLCLKWWARNRIVIEKNIDQDPRLLLVDYDKLVIYPKKEVGNILEFIGFNLNRKINSKLIISRITSDIHSKSQRKFPHPFLRQEVRQLCNDLAQELEQSYLSNRKMHGFK